MKTLNLTENLVKFSLVHITTMEVMYNKCMSLCHFAAFFDPSKECNTLIQCDYLVKSFITSEIT